MKRKLFIAASFVIIGAALCRVLCFPTPLSSRCLDFKVAARLPVQKAPRTFFVVVSNASDCTAEYGAGFNKVWFSIAYLTNGVWQTDVVYTPGGGPALLKAHDTRRDNIVVPENATAFKVGLSVTSLTWRGRFAWVIAGSRFSELLKPLSRSLHVRDQKNRSTIEWSDEYPLIPIAGSRSLLTGPEVVTNKSF
jgi:hypothetical protein